MPNDIIKSFADKSGKSVEEVEKLWNDTEAIVKKEYPDKKDDEYYKLLVGILKKRLNVVDEDAVMTTSSMGGASAQFRPMVFPTMARFATFTQPDSFKTNSTIKTKKTKKKTEDVHTYINDKLKLSEEDSATMKQLVQQYAQASIKLQKQIADKQRKQAGSSFMAGPAKQKQIAAAKILQQKTKEMQANPNLTSDDILNSLT